MANIFKTMFLLTALTLLMMLLGHTLGGEQGMILAFGIACVMNFVAYWFSDQMVLSAYRAQPLSETDSPEIYKIVRDLADQAKIPMPRIYLIPSSSPNAFATGRNPKNAVVAVTEGIITMLNREEMKAVLGHELGHVIHRDILISTITATLAGAITMFANMARWSLMFGGSRREGERSQNPIVLLLMVILVPIAATLIQLAVSRSREYHADETGARLCGNPLHLASALRRIESGAKLYGMRGADPSTAHLFIVNPLTGKSFAQLFSTHPPVEERVARLEEMAAGGMQTSN